MWLVLYKFTDTIRCNRTSIKKSVNQLVPHSPAGSLLTTKGSFSNSSSSNALLVMLMKWSSRHVPSTDFKWKSVNRPLVARDSHKNKMDTYLILHFFQHQSVNQQSLQQSINLNLYIAPLRPQLSDPCSPLKSIEYRNLLISYRPAYVLLFFYVNSCYNNPKKNNFGRKLRKIITHLKVQIGSSTVLYKCSKNKHTYLHLTSSESDLAQ